MVKLENGYRIAYDELTDTLYLSIGEPKKATESYLDEDHILVRKDHEVVTGITIEGFLARQDDRSWKDSFILKYLPKFNLEFLSEIGESHINESCLKGKIIIPPINFQEQKTFITEHDLITERTPQELVNWVDTVIKEIACQKGGKTALRRREGLCKHLMEELYPLSILAKIEFYDRNDITLKLIMGNQSYDAIIRFSDCERKLEITQAHEGELRVLRVDMLEKEGWYPVSGRIEKSGSKNKGKELNWSMGVKNLEDSLYTQKKLIVEAIRRKVREQYDSKTNLLVVFDDRIASLVENANEVLSHLVKEECNCTVVNFPVVYIVGFGLKIFFKLEPGINF